MSSTPMRSTIKRGALIAGGSALALFALMFCDWFTDVSPASGWSGLGWLQVALVIAAIAAAVGFAVVTFTEAAVSPPVALSAIVTGVGAITFLALLYAVIDPPGADAEKELGLFGGLLATAGIVAGGYLGMQEEPAGASPY